MLNILRSEGHDLPKDARTLLGRSRRSSNITSCGSGDYLHYGFEKALTNIMNEQMPETLMEVNILVDLNIDGLPLAKSSKSQLWPILGKIVSPFKSRVFFIGAYHGNVKPSSFVHEFLDSFIQEFKDIKNN